MSNAYKPLWGLFAILVGVTAVVVAARAMRAEERIQWRTDFAAAQAEARQAGKPVFAYFTATWCGPCQNLKHTTWADAKVEAALQGYVPVKVDIDEQPDLAASFGVSAIPAYAVLPNSEEAKTRATAGYMGPPDLLAWLTAGGS